MKAATVFVHRHLPRAVLKGEPAVFFCVSMGRRGALALADELTGDLLAERARWCFNITRATLVHVIVLSQHATLRAAVRATTTHVLPMRP